MNAGTIIKVSGPLVIAKGLTESRMYEMVRVGEERLYGEIIEIRGDEYAIQVYEETEGLGPGGPVYPTGEALSVELGPGLIQSIYDGVQRPLNVLNEKFGEYIIRGAESPALDRERKWQFVPSVEVGTKAVTGDILGSVQETTLVSHKIMVPAGLEGEVVSISEREATIEEEIAVIKSSSGEVKLTMLQNWPVRVSRGVVKKLPPNIPLITGQRVIDMFFPLTKGGTACVPGPFGSGKTVVQHQLAKWADAEIIVYVGCGERGNEMTDVLLEFPELKDPKSGEPLMLRTVLIANTSNMPVAAREASVFTGITIAEYFRDMGYNVALMADSTSRWAEAMREISGRLEEMPGDEGYPAYMGSRIASFYERSGNAICLGSNEREGTLSLIGAVSPPGGDLGDPVVQSTLRVVKVFWGLDDKLAFQRHFPAINWLSSYSLYTGTIDSYASEHLAPDWSENRTEAMSILQREAELEELVRLVGIDALSPQDRLLMEVARMVREDFLHQNAFDERDTYTSLEKQYKMLVTILEYYRKARQVIEAGAELDDVLSISSRDKVTTLKLTGEDKLEEIDGVREEIIKELESLVKEGETTESKEEVKREGVK